MAEIYKAIFLPVQKHRMEVELVLSAPVISLSWSITSACSCQLPSNQTQIAVYNLNQMKDCGVKWVIVTAAIVCCTLAHVFLAAPKRATGAPWEAWPQIFKRDEKKLARSEHTWHAELDSSGSNSYVSGKRRPPPTPIALSDSEF